jgi:hypothetical protein
MAIHSSDSGCRGLRRAIRRRRQWRLHEIRRGRYEGAIAPPVATAILRPPARSVASFKCRQVCRRASVVRS